MSFLRICPSKQRVFHHLVKQLRKPDIKLIPSLVSCRYREDLTRKHPAVDSYPSSSLSNWYQPIPISSGYFPVYMYLSIDSRRAESRGRCAIPSIHLCGGFFCSRFGLFLQHVWMRLPIRSMTSTFLMGSVIFKFQVFDRNTCEI